METNFLAESIVTGQGLMVLNQECKFRLDLRKKSCTMKVAQVVHRGGKCSIPGNVQGNVGQGSWQPDLGEDVSAYCGGLD